MGKYFKIDKIALLFLTVYLSIMSVYLYKHQYYNSDIEAYMGLVYQNNFPKMDIETIHKKVYAELKIKNPKLLEANNSATEKTIGENTYYKTIAQSPEIYEEELQLFKVKPFYNFINLGFYKIGFSASVSTFMISIVSYFLIVFFIFLFFKSQLSNVFLALSLSILVSLFKPLLEASRHASPDVLACLLLLVSVYFIFIKRNLFVATIFGMLCILTRPDYFIFYSLFLVLLYFFRKNFNFEVKTLLFSFVYFLLCFGLIQFFNQIPWSVLFMNQFTKVQLYPVSHPDVLRILDYFNVIKSSLFLEFNASYFPILLMIIVSVLSSKYSLNKENIQFFAFFLLIIYASVFIRFFIFPSLVNRMMLGFYLLIILSVIFILNGKRQLFRNSSH
ncbi:hypothetical protein [Halpernia sp. GG3]